MNQTKPKEVRTLSIRIPMDLYLKVSQHGLDRDFSSLNATVISLLESGMASAIERHEVLSKFIQEIVSPEKLKEIINGK